MTGAAGAPPSGLDVMTVTAQCICDPAGSHRTQLNSQVGIPSARSVPVCHMDSLAAVEQSPAEGSQRAVRAGAGDSPLRPDPLTRLVHNPVQSKGCSDRRRVSFSSQVSSHEFHPADRLLPYNSSSALASLPPEVSIQGPFKVTTRFKAGTLSSLGACRGGAPSVSAHPDSTRCPGMQAPPGLLGQMRPPRPSEIAHIRLRAVDAQPASLLQYPLSEVPLGQLKVLSKPDDSEGSIRRYTCLDRLFHVATRRAAEDWTLADYVADAISSNPENVRSARVLLPPLANLHEPQVVLTASALPLGHFVIPIDMRALGGKICCLEARPFMDGQDLINTLMQACGRPPALAIQAAHAHALFLQDPLGQVWEQLPGDISELGWLRLQLDFTRLPAELLADLRPAGGTTSTTTGALPLVSQGTNVVFMLTGCGATIWSIPQLISTVNVQQNIQELVQALGLRGTIPERAQLQVTAACPLSRVAGVSTVTLLCHPADDDVHIVYDASTDGSLAHAMTVNPGTMPRDVMMPAHPGGLCC